MTEFPVPPLQPLSGEAHIFDTKTGTEFVLTRHGVYRVSNQQPKEGAQP